MVIADREAEDAVLGSLVIGGNAYMPAILDTGLRGEHFSGERGRLTFEAAVAAFDSGQAIDEITVPLLAGYGGGVPTLSNAPEYARKVVQKARWRDTQAAGHLLVQAAQEENTDLQSEAESLLATREEGKRAYSPDRLASLMLDRMEQGEPPGWWMPFLKGRLVPGTVQLWGGWTSHGKTVWIDQVCRHLHKSGVKVWAWLNEMNAEERVCRHVASTTGIPLDRIEDNKLSADEMSKVVRALKTVPWGITECPGWEANRICRDIRVRRPDVAVIDILHRIPYENERDLARISRLLGDTAKLANCAILATVHLNRGRIVTPARPRPTLSDIKGASAFEQDADVVGMVWREDDETTGKPGNVGEIYTLKWRQGRPHGIEVVFDGARAVFERGY